MIDTAVLPSVNALLNTTAAVFLCAGFVQIRRKNIEAHRLCMLGALASSAAFLTTYLIYHALHGSTKFMGTGWVRPAYFSLLLTHTVLAAAVLPLVLVTLTRALKGDFLSHKSVARWTLPIWLYVSITGVTVYWMLYHGFRPA